MTAPQTAKTRHRAVSVILAPESLLRGRAERVAGDRPQDLRPRAHASEERAADLAPPHARPVVHRDLAHPEPSLRRLHLHLHRPAEVAVAHVQAVEGLRGHRPEGAEIGGPGADEPVHEGHAEARPEHGMEGAGSPRPTAEGAPTGAEAGL